MSTEKHAYLALKRLQPAAFWHRVENSAGTGTPDVFYCREGRSAWVENKVGVRRGDDTVICRKMRRAQYAWLTEYTRHGGRGIIGVYVQNKLYLFNFSTITWRALTQGTWAWEEFQLFSRDDQLP